MVFFKGALSSCQCTILELFELRNVIHGSFNTEDDAELVVRALFLVRRKDCHL